MSHTPPDFIEKLRSVRERVPRDTWLALAAGYRGKSGVPDVTAAANLANTFLNPDQSWTLRQVLREHVFASWAELATAIEVVDVWVLSSPRLIDIVWTGPANGTFPIRRIDQVLYDLLAKSMRRVFMVTFSAHRIPLLCEHLNQAIARGVEVTLLLESEKSSAGQLSFDASNAFKDLGLDQVRLLHWPIENREQNQAGKPGKLHVKCAVIDDTALIGSANLTDDAFNRNMELGVVIRDRCIVENIRNHFRTLENNGVLRRA